MSREELSLMLIKIVVSMVFLSVTIHILLYRTIFKDLLPKSPQMLLLKVLLLMNIPLIILLIFMPSLKDLDGKEIFATFFFSITTYNCLSYFYFHFFNLSETARRIHMLNEIYFRNNSLTVTNLKKIYSQEGMIYSRLNRLVDMNQIYKDENEKYHMKSFFFLNIAKTLKILRMFIYYR